MSRLPPSIAESGQRWRRATARLRNAELSPSPPLPTPEITPATLTFHIPGIAAPQGSLRIFPSRNPGQRGRMVADHGGKVRRWRRTVSLFARRAMERRALIPGPLRLEVTFLLPRPKSLTRRIEKPERKPDLDKLVRAIGDALEGVVYPHDAQITTVVARKRFGDPARAEISIGPDLES